MKAIIDTEPVDVKVIENLGYQFGKYAKVVEYNGSEYVVIKHGRQ
jgi:hypothetical protein